MHNHNNHKTSETIDRTVFSQTFMGLEVERTIFCKDHYSGTLELVFKTTSHSITQQVDTVH